ncbi:MAG: hypothetical protein GTO18_10855 [Anaerolineales bacterium]|nr:hypothetical protein [Anaerolineales bacterium]
MNNQELNEEQIKPQDELTMYIVFIVVVAVAYIATIAGLEVPITSPRVLVSLAIGILFTILGTIGFERITRLDSLPTLILYFLFQLALAGAAIYVSPDAGALWIMALPLISQAAIALANRGLVIYCFLTVAMYIAVNSLTYGQVPGLQTTLGYSVAVFFVAVFSIIYGREAEARREIQRLAGRLEELNRQLSEYAVQAEELAITKERNRLASEIHDSLGHYLTVVNVQLEAARAVFDEDPSAACDSIKKAQELTKEGLAEVRRSVAALRASPLEDRPLVDAIEALLEECRHSGLTANLKVSGERGDVPPQVDHTLYRATQEGLTNVRKHARASNVEVRLDYSSGDDVRLVIEDNGVGSDAESPQEGFGLLGMRERVGLLGGRVETRDAENRGFILDVWIPR